MNGHAGKILRLNLTNRSFDTINTSQYDEWVGGLAMGTALFWDEVDKDYITDTQGKSGFEPENVMIILSGPLQGTIAPSGGRCEIVGMSPEAYPRPQFSRGNMGGRFSAMMKFAGYDAIVVKGAADAPVWVNIVDDSIIFEDASAEGYGLWGLDTFETQHKIWQIVGDEVAGQVPAVALMGQAGENLCRNATVQTGDGTAVGQGGFGAVMGSKNLKAISVLGTKSVPIARPKELLEAREWYRSYFSNGLPGGFSYMGRPDLTGRPTSCFGCDRACHQTLSNPTREIMGDGMMCVETYFNSSNDRKRFGHLAEWVGYEETDITSNNPPGGMTDGMITPGTWLGRYGINAYELSTGGLAWLKSLYMRGYLGKGKRIETDLDFSKCGKEDGSFALELLRRIAFREEIGDDLAEGCVRAAKKWGVLEEDLMNGALPMIYWIGEAHWGVYVCWAYESLFGVRDINMHRNSTVVAGKSDPAEMEKNAARFAEMEAPWHDPMGIDRSEDGIYSSSMAKCVSWGRRYSIFYVNSTMLCDWNAPLWSNSLTEDGKGLSPEFETRFLNAITGLDFTYEDGLEVGRKAWNLQRAIVTMHGRHRDEEYFPPFPPYDSYVYHEGEPYLQSNKTGSSWPSSYATWKDEGWVADPCRFPLKKDRMDEFKTIYYDLEGWDTATGWPTRSGLESLGLGSVADELESRDRLGAE